MSPSLLSIVRSLPRTTRWILAAIASGSLFLSFTLTLFPIMGLPSPLLLMGVGEWTVRHGWWWQVGTYWMSAAGPMQFGLTLLLITALDLFFVAQISSRIERRLGAAATALIWLGACLTGGILGAVALDQGWLGSGHLLIGNRTGLAGLLIAWMMTVGDEVLWFFVAPVRGKWLALGLLAMDWLQLLSHGNWAMLVASAAAATFVYLLCVIGWGLSAPFEAMWRLEAPLRWLSRAIRQAMAPLRSGSKQGQAVIIDFRTGEEIRR